MKYDAYIAEDAQLLLLKPQDRDGENTGWLLEGDGSASEQADTMLASNGWTRHTDWDDEGWAVVESPDKRVSMPAPVDE